MSMTDSAAENDKPQIELRCKVDVALLNLLRDFVCSVSRHLGFSDAQVAEIEICVDEACANAMEHAYVRTFGAEPTENDYMVGVELRYSGEELVIRVIDKGCGANEPLGKRVQKLEEYLDSAREKYRGLGFHMMHKFMDRVDVQSAPGQGTTVEMTKYRR